MVYFFHCTSGENTVFAYNGDKLTYNLVVKCENSVSNLSNMLPLLETEICLYDPM